MILCIQLHPSSPSLSKTVRVCEVFGVKRARSTVHNWVHKANLQPESGKNPYRVAVHETMIQLNDEQYRLYAETNELLHKTLEPTRTTMIAQKFLTELGEKQDVSEAVFFINRAQLLQVACHRIDYDCRYRLCSFLHRTAIGPTDSLLGVFIKSKRDRSKSGSRQSRWV